MTTTGYESFVARGAALLDDTVPGWPVFVNVETLSMRSPTLCVLGQVFSDAEAHGVRTMRGDTVFPFEYDGFNVGRYVLGITAWEQLRWTGFDAHDYVSLTQAWRDYIVAARPA